MMTNKEREAMMIRFIQGMTDGSCAKQEEVIVTPVVEEVEEVEEVVEVAPVVELVSIEKPSDRFDIDDYIAYSEYMVANGGVPSIEDYFNARQYYMSK